jgi:hypothetical protein
MKCPGQDTQYWNTDAVFEIECPRCGAPLEFFKDDAARRCGACKEKIVNPKMDFGCASYCKFAEQCLGSLPEEFVAKRRDLFKDRLAVEVKKYLGTDFKRIGRVSKMVGYAEKIAGQEKADLPVILCAACLYDIGAQDDIKTDSADDRRKIREESAAIGRKLMEKLGAPPRLTDEVIALISAPEDETDRTDNAGISHRILHDADTLVHMAACRGKEDIPDDVLSARIRRLFMTEAGRELAGRVLLSSD